MAIKKYNEFFETEKNAINEAEEMDERDIVYSSPDFVYEDEKLKKIASIVYNALNKSGLGEFWVKSFIVYVNGVPGVLFSNKNKNIFLVCCREGIKKTIHIFDDTKINAECETKASYSTDKLGFKDVIDQVIDDLKALEETDDVNESAAPAGWKASLKYGVNDIKKFLSIADVDRKYMYELLEKTSANSAKNLIWGQYMGGSEPGNSICLKMSKNGASATETNARFACFIAGDAIKNAYPDIDEMVELNNDYKTLCKGGSGVVPISVSGPESVELTDCDASVKIAAARAAAEEAAIKEDLDEYRDTLKRYSKMVSAMADYIQQYGRKTHNGKTRSEYDDDVIVGNLKGTRCIIVTGKKGVGKSNAIAEAIESKHLVENRDYINITSGSSLPEAIFHYLYQYNGKLIIFDDTPDLFSTPRKLALWKAAFQNGPGNRTGKVPAEVTYARDVKDRGGDGDSGFYDPKKAGLTRQQRYFLETGTKSETDKENFFKKERKILQAERGVSYDKATADAEISEKWEEMLENSQPLMPKAFTFNGFVIIISNEDRAQLRGELKEHWSAIADRAKNFDLSPRAESMWYMIKEKILAQKEMTDDECPKYLRLIPSKYVDEFVKYIDTLIVKSQYKNMSWRIMEHMSDIMRTDETANDWKKDIREYMDINLS